MTTIHAVTYDQVLSATVLPKVASDNQNTVRFHVDFDTTWDGYAKSVVFHTSKNPTPYEKVLSSDGICIVPPEVLTEPCHLYIGVKGVNGDKVKNSTELRFKIKVGAPLLVMSGPTGDVYHQLLQENSALAARVNNIAKLPSGSTTGDAELIDARVGFNGEIHETAGEAVRNQMKAAYENAVGKVSFSDLPLIPSGLITAADHFEEEADYVAGYILPVSIGVGYDLTIEGEANRFFVMGCHEYPKLNGACEALTGNVIETTNHIRLINEKHSYFFIGIGYEIDTSGIKLTARHDVGGFAGNHINAPYTERTITEFVEVGVGSGGNLNHLAGVRGCIFPIRRNSVYELTVNGAHNRFSVYGIKGFPTIGHGTECILSSPTVFPENHSVTFENSEYDYAVINIGYNITSDAPLVVREYGKATYDLINSDKNRVIKRTFYSTPSDVECVANTSELYALYDKLVTDYPEFVSVIEFDSNLREYMFTTGDYNCYSPRRDIDPIIHKPVILIHSGTHGYERSAVMSAYQFFRDLCAGKPYLSDIRGNYAFKIIPLVCPTAFDANSRVNSNGVNIARNYSVNWRLTADDGNDYGGAKACDQIETQICEEWIRANKGAKLFIDFHNSGFTDEVACLMGAAGLVDVSAIKKTFLTSVHPLIRYWQDECGCDPSLIYAYTGNFVNLATAYHYADSLGIPALCLETSWEQNNEARHSMNTIRIGAEVLGNMLVGVLKQSGESIANEYNGAMSIT